MTALAGRAVAVGVDPVRIVTGHGDCSVPPKYLSAENSSRATRPVVAPTGSIIGPRVAQPKAPNADLRGPVASGAAVRPPTTSQNQIGDGFHLAWGRGGLEPARERIEVLERAKREPGEVCDTGDLHLVGAVGGV